MSKPVKWLFGTVIVLVALIIIIPLCLPLFINPNDYKETIAQKVQEQTGRTLAIPGDIDLDFSLIGLNTVFKMGQVRLSSSKDFPETEFFSSNDVEIDLALWPLIKNKELKVNRIRLDGVSINLVKNEKGVSSWEDLAGGAQPQPKAEQQEKPADKSGKGPVGIDIGEIQAQNINLSYTDNQVGRTVKLSGLNLDTGRIRQGHPFPFKADFELFLENSGQQPLSAKIDTKSNFTFFLTEQHFIVDGFNLKGLVKDSSLPTGEIDFEISADIDLALQKQIVDIRKISVRQGKMQVDTMLTIAGLSDPQINGSLRIPQFSPRNQAELFGINLPVEDPQTLTKMSAEFDFSGNLAEIQVSKMNLNFDETTVNGKASVTNFLQPAYDLTLHINQLDLDRYTAGKKTEQIAETSTSPPASTSTSQAPPSQPQKNADQIIIPVEQLRKLIFNAEVNIDKLKAAKLNMTNMQFKANGRDGLIRVEPFATDFYDGNITVTADIDARPDTPVLHVINDLKSVELGPMFIDMTGKEEIKGRADIHADITSKGSTRNELNRNANGTMGLSLADGEIAKLKIIDTIRTAKALLGSKKKEEQQDAGSKDPSSEKQPTRQKVDSGRSTTFANLTATGVITNGVFKNDDLHAESELMKVEGKGTVDIVNEQIDYLLTIYLAKSIDRNEETGLVDLADTPIPYRVKGSFDKIAQSAALEELIKSEAKKVLIKELEKQFGGDETKEGDPKKESSDSTKDLLNKGLKSLFGN